MTDQNIETSLHPEPPKATRLNKLALVVAAVVMSATLFTIAFMAGGEEEARHASQARVAAAAVPGESFMDRPPADRTPAVNPFTGLSEEGPQDAASEVEVHSQRVPSYMDGQGSFGPGVTYDPTGMTPPPMYQSGSYYDDPAPRQVASRASPREEAMQRALRSGLIPQGQSHVSAGESGSLQEASYSSLGRDAVEDYDAAYLETLREIKTMFPTQQAATPVPFPGAATQSGGQVHSPGPNYGRAEVFMQQAASSRSGSNYISQHLERPHSPYEIREGTLIEALLLTGIHSDLPGEVVAQVSRNIYDSQTQQVLLIPKGTRLIGSYDNQVALDQSRLLVAWTRLVLPDGRSLNLPGLSSKDPAGANGLPGRVNRHYWQAFGNALMLAVVGGSLTYATSSQRQAGIYGYPTPGDIAAGSVATELSRVATEILRGSVGRRPTIRIKEGTRFNVFLNGDLVLAPYASQDGFMQHAGGDSHGRRSLLHSAGMVR